MSGVMSAAALAAFKSCPLRYRFRYVDGLYWSTFWGSTQDERRSIEKGQQFHLLARRFYAGVDPGKTGASGDLSVWLRNLQAFLPFTFDRSFYPELELWLHRPAFRLMATFDLLVVDPDGRATIYDWKTESRPPSRQRLLGSAQTLVYRYLLCAAGGAYSPRGSFAPEEISMVYWNPVHPRRSERIGYSRAEFEQDDRDLAERIQGILGRQADQFPATSDLKTCSHCEYQMICHRKPPVDVEWEEEESLPPDFWTDEV